VVTLQGTKDLSGLEVLPWEVREDPVEGIHHRTLDKTRGTKDKAHLVLPIKVTLNSIQDQSSGRKIYVAWMRSLATTDGRQCRTNLTMTGNSLKMKMKSRRGNWPQVWPMLHLTLAHPQELRKKSKRIATASGPTIFKLKAVPLHCLPVRMQLLMQDDRVIRVDHCKHSNSYQTADHFHSTKMSSGASREGNKRMKRTKLHSEPRSEGKKKNADSNKPNKVIVHRQEMSNGNPSIRTEATTAGEIGTIAIIGIENVIGIVNESAIGIDTKMRNMIDVLLKGT